jgi:F420-0:gamma-glutamyl ligase
MHARERTLSRMLVRPVKTRIFREGDDLVAFIRDHIPNLKERSVLVITSKLVSLAEGATAPSDESKESLIRKRADRMIRTPHHWLTITDGMLVSSAGIDQSNGDGKYILLPKKGSRTAATLVRTLRRIYKVRELGVLITDSRTLPLRAGALGLAIDYAGFKGLRPYRGTKDLFGRIYKIERANIGDALAASAVLSMGEGAERQPLAVITDAPIVFNNAAGKNELVIKLADDRFLPYVHKFFKK